MTIGRLEFGRQGPEFPLKNKNRDIIVIF